MVGVKGKIGVLVSCEEEPPFAKQTIVHDGEGEKKAALAWGTEKAWRGGATEEVLTTTLAPLDRQT